MLQRLYIHNYRCFENFELSLQETPSILLVGKNGSGKSTIADALQVFQNIGRRVNRVGTLVKPKDFAWGRSKVPIRFEIEVLLKGKLYEYSLALELPERFKELRVAEERLTVGGDNIFIRQEAQVTLHARPNHEAQFFVDCHLAALPLIQEQSETDPLFILKTWLSRMIIFSPIPILMSGDSDDETLEPKRDGSNFSEWLTGLLTRYPAAYTPIEKYLRKVMPDLKDFLNEPTGKETKSTTVRFEERDADLSVSFKDLSDGEKCFFLCAAVLAANQFYGPLFCFWDEPDNYLSLSEVGHFVTDLRRSFLQKGQILTTSHNPEAIRKFAPENTLALIRRGHLEPTSARLVSDLPIKEDLIDALILGDIDHEFK